MTHDSTFTGLGEVKSRNMTYIVSEAKRKSLSFQLTIDYGEALDILSDDFTSVAPAVLCHPAPPTQASYDFALDALAEDFVSPAVAPAVKSAVDCQVQRHTYSFCYLTSHSYAETLFEYRP
uniref:Uncharacterized protein n=1 Tax=Hucho hucho TaxID=62062 RepID=A0A4W5P246_9TELE